MNALRIYVRPRLILAETRSVREVRRKTPCSWPQNSEVFSWHITCNESRRLQGVRTRRSSASIDQFKELDMNHDSRRITSRLTDRSGKIKYGIFAWLLGLPLPIILLALFFGGCDF